MRPGKETVTSIFAWLIITHSEQKKGEQLLDASPVCRRSA